VKLRVDQAFGKAAEFRRRFHQLAAQGDFTIKSRIANVQCDDELLTRSLCRCQTGSGFMSRCRAIRASEVWSDDTRLL
jgi:hypothetical protein